mgnify:CR=1 FL=1
MINKPKKILVIFSTILLAIVFLLLSFFSQTCLEVQAEIQYESILDKKSLPQKDSLDIVALLFIKNTFTVPISINDIKPLPPPKCVQFKLLNKSFTLNPGQGIVVYASVKYYNYCTWKIKTVVIEYKYFGFIVKKSFPANIFFVAAPPREYPVLSGFVEIYDIETTYINAKINETVCIVLYLKVLENWVKIKDVKVMNINSSELFHLYTDIIQPRVSCKGDLVKVTLGFIPKRKGIYEIKRLKVIWSLDENIYTVYLDLIRPVKIVVQSNH